MSIFQDHLNSPQLEAYVQRLEAIPGKEGTLEKYYQEQQSRWKEGIELLELNNPSPEALIVELHRRVQLFNEELVVLLGDPNVSTQEGWDALVSVTGELVEPGTTDGFFIKTEVLVDFLQQKPPKALLAHLGYETVDQCLENESIFEIVSALRFAESEEWMNDYLTMYDSLRPEHFEHRPVQFLLLAPEKWWELAGPFAKKKKHHFSHLKEVGIVFSYPAPNHNSEATALAEFFMMMLHYIYEVKFYSNFFEYIAKEHAAMGTVFMSVLTGDGDIPDPQEHELPILQQYHLKKPDPMPLAFHPHVMPEGFHYTNASNTMFALLDRSERRDDFAFWKNRIDVATMIDGELYTLNFADNVLSRDVHLTYHYKEDLWNAIFAAYFGQKALVDITIQYFSNKMINLNEIS